MPYLTREVKLYLSHLAVDFNVESAKVEINHNALGVYVGRNEKATIPPDFN